MKVLVVGSIDKRLPAGEREEVCDACRAIGEELARRGNTIIIGSDSTDTVDRFIVEGANKGARRAKVLIYRTDRSGKPTDDYIPFSGMEDELPNVKFTVGRATGPWYSAHLEGIRLADAVIVISGGRGTEIAGYNSYILEKPLLPIPVFGGGAKLLWNDFRRLYDTVGLTGDESRSLFERWGPKSSVCVSSALNKISSNNPFAERSRRLWRVAVGTAAALFVAWLSIFYLGRDGSLSRDLSVILLILISAVLGTTLRHVLRMREPQPAKVDLSSLAVEAVAGSLIAFGFLMFFYLGTVVITGAPISLTDAPDSPTARENFRRLAFSMTILGMAAGFLLERAANALRRRFGTVLGDHVRPTGDAVD